MEEFEGANDIGVVDFFEDLQLAHHSFFSHLRGAHFELGHHLDGHLHPQLQMCRLIHHPKCTFTNDPSKTVQLTDVLYSFQGLDLTRVEIVPTPGFWLEGILLMVVIKVSEFLRNTHPTIATRRLLPFFDGACCELDSVWGCGLRVATVGGPPLSICHTTRRGALQWHHHIGARKLGLILRISLIHTQAAERWLSHY